VQNIGIKKKEPLCGISDSKSGMKSNVLIRDAW